MRRALAVLLLLLLVSPLVSAGGVSYYPDKASFTRFIHSNATYRVVPGRDYWAKGWARYVDAKLGEVLEHGNGTLVLVGNVYENPEMKRLWNLTGLPESASLSPMVIVVNNTLFVTGSEDNIYLTHDAFSEIWVPPKTSLALFALLAFAIVLLFGLSLRADRSYSARFFLLGASLIFVWFTLSETPVLPSNFLEFFSRALSVSAGAVPSSPLLALIGHILSAVPPTDETLWLAHWLFLLTLTGLFFYVAPKRERALGFIAFGLVFSAPLFRSQVATVGIALPGLVLMLLAIAVATNSSFVPGSRRTLEILALAGATLLASIFNPYLLLFPLFFALTYPGRKLRNSSYLVLVWAGFWALCRVYGFDWLSKWTSFQPHPGFVENLILQSLLGLVIVVYALLTGLRRIRWRGPTAFITLSTLAFLLIAPFVGGFFPYALTLVSILAVRLVHSVIQT
ncbi:hypothetical protein [Thermococcus sp. 21S9]|uniref:hypothetical protein n=1 Tax=Thermococcus sp. 21S9 TaxID=1638223 RepID=UPI00143C314F|nr:hypothetical protein [Thermococcus sp. 21S9]NJE54239.1 hypothetical protein [Thermococcus sp. 21S9]